MIIFNNRDHRVRPTLLNILLLTSLVGCSITAETTPEAPSSAHVTELLRTRDSSIPVFVLHIEPIKLVSDRMLDYCRHYPGPQALMNAALVNALSSSGNFAVIDPDHPLHLSPQLRPEEVGPFLIKVSLTELNHHVESQERGVSINFKDSDSVLEMLGKVTLMIPGFWITQITGLPTSWVNNESKGVVALDVVVSDLQTGRVVTSFPARASFTLRSREVGNRMAGYYSKDAIGSPIESAVRVAMNDTASKILEALQRNYQN